MEETWARSASQEFGLQASGSDYTWFLALGSSSDNIHHAFVTQPKTARNETVGKRGFSGRA